MKFTLSKKELDLILPILKANKETSDCYRFNHIYMNDSFIYFGNTDLELFILSENNNIDNIDNTEYISIFYKYFIKIVKNIDNIEFETDNDNNIIYFTKNNVKFSLINGQRIDSNFFFFDYDNLDNKINIKINNNQNNKIYKAILPIILDNNASAYMKDSEIIFKKDNFIIKISKTDKNLKEYFIYEII